jgi:hypothetical protein
MKPGDGDDAEERVDKNWKMKGVKHKKRKQYSTLLT